MNHTVAATSEGSSARGELKGERMNTTRGDYAEVNGLRMYYETRGTGRPLVLLHGAYMTADVADRPITYEGMADDVAALIRRLGIDEADAFGFSMGGGVALQLAIRHPG